MRNGVEDELEDGLLELDPAASEHVDLDSAWDSFLRYRQTQLSEVGPQPRRSRPWARWRLPALAPAATLLAIVALGIVAALSEDDATEPLALAADRAMAQSPTATAADSVSYAEWRTSATLETSVANGVAWSTRRALGVQTSVNPDGSGKVHTVRSRESFVGPRDYRRAVEAGHGNGLDGPSQLTADFGPGELGPGGSKSELDELPGDPGAVADALTADAERSRGGMPQEARMLELAAMQLFQPGTPAETRAAVFDALADAPALTELGTARDPEDRQGAAVGMVSDYSGTEVLYRLIFDPDAAEVLAYEEIVLERVDYADAEPPFTLTDRIFLHSR